MHGAGVYIASLLVPGGEGGEVGEVKEREAR